MAGLIADSMNEDSAGLHGLADVAGMQQRQQLKNIAIDAQKNARKYELGGEIVGTAIGSIWHQPGLGYKYGKQWGDLAGSVFAGASTPGSQQGQGDGGSGMMLGSLFQFLGSGSGAGSMDESPCFGGASNAVPAAASAMIDA